MMLKKIILSSLAILMSHLITDLAHAGFKVGNGGMIAVCIPNPAQGIREVEIPDALEARFRWNLDIKLSQASGWKNKVQAVIPRLSYQDHWQQTYRQSLNSFLSEARFVEGELPDTGDGDHLPLPTTCHIKQAIVQVIPEVPHEARYYINKTWWEKLDEDQKAMLVLHEIIYKEANLSIDEDSRWVRYLNALLWSDEFINTNFEMQAKIFLQLLRYPFINWNGFPLIKMLSAQEFLLGPGKVALSDRDIDFKHINTGELKISQGQASFVMNDVQITDKTAAIAQVKNVSGKWNQGKLLDLSIEHIGLKNGFKDLASNWMNKSGQGNLVEESHAENDFYLSFKFNKNDSVRFCKNLALPKNYQQAKVTMTLRYDLRNGGTLGDASKFNYEIQKNNQILWSQQIKKSASAFKQTEINLPAGYTGVNSFCISFHTDGGNKYRYLDFKDFEIIVK